MTNTRIVKAQSLNPSFTSANISGALTVSGTTALLGTLSCSGAAQFSSTVVVAGAVAHLSTLTQTGNASFQGVAIFSSTVAVLGTFSCTGAAEFSSTAVIAGAVSHLSTLTQTGNAFFQGTSRFSGTVTILGATNAFAHANPSQVVDILGQTHITNNSSSLPAVALQLANKNTAQSTSVQIAFGPHATGDTGRLIFENAASTAATNFRLSLHNNTTGNDRFQITNDAILRLGRDLILSTASFVFDSAQNRASFAHANPSQTVDISGNLSVAGSATVLTAGSFSIRTTVPTTFTAAGAPGQLAFTQNATTATAGYIYWAFATNTWTRFAVTTQPAFN